MTDAMPFLGHKGVPVAPSSVAKTPMNIAADEVCDEVRVFANTHKLVAPSHIHCRRVRNALLNASFADDVSMQELRMAVCEFTAELREDGITPEAILVSLKSVVSNRTVPPLLSPTSEWSDLRMRDQISTWSIDEFFRSASATQETGNPIVKIKTEKVWKKRKRQGT